MTHIIIYQHMILSFFFNDSQHGSMVLVRHVSSGTESVAYRGSFSEAHGPSSLCVDLVNYLGCQSPTTAYPRRGVVWGGCNEACERMRGFERDGQKSL